MATAGITVRVPAKVNLELRVGPPRPDGYHELATVFHAIGLFDDLSVELADGVSIEVDGPEADLVPTDGRNLAVQAATLLAERTGITDGVAMHLRKGIPVAGGMAGGSADAAAALVACDQLWNAGLSRDDLHELACELGSDVPFALLGGTAVGTGRGERLTPALARGEYHWVVAPAGRGLPTPQVYAEIDRLRGAGGAPPPRSEPEVSPGLMQALRAGDAEGLGDALANDLQPAALSLDPALERTLSIGRRTGALGAIVSGSGPTVVFLARDNGQALDIAVALTASGCVPEVHRTIGPVGGARLVEAVRG